MSDFWNLPDGVEEIVPPLSTNLEKTKTELLDYFQNKGFDNLLVGSQKYYSYLKISLYDLRNTNRPKVCYLHEQ